MVVLDWTLGGGANASIVVDSLAQAVTCRKAAASPRSTGPATPAWRRLAGVATVLGSLALAGCGSTAAASAQAASPTATSGTQTTSPTQTAGSVPAQYQSQYATIQAQTLAFQAMAGSPASAGSTTVGVELLAANGNIGTGLLTSHAISGVDTELDAARSLGIRGVTVCVSFPMLLPGTPDSSRYLSFYEHVAQQVRARGMVLSVEENPIFAGTPLTTLPISYSGLTLTSYAAEERQEAQIIIDDLGPQYLSLLPEPDTYSSVLHLAIDTPAAATQVVTDELTGLNRGATLVGAGTGTWSSPAIDQSLLTTSIDYLDVHVYPEAPADLANLARDVSAAKAAGRPLVMDETWPYKDFADGSFSTDGTS